MSLNWLFANRISRQPVATWEDCVGPASLRTMGLQARGDLASAPSCDAGAGSIPRGGPGVFSFVSARGISVSLEASDRSLPQQSADSRLAILLGVKTLAAVRLGGLRGFQMHRFSRATVGD